MKKGSLYVSACVCLFAITLLVIGNLRTKSESEEKLDTASAKVREYLEQKASAALIPLRESMESEPSPADLAASDVLEYVSCHDDIFTRHFSGVYLKGGTVYILVTEYHNEYDALLADVLQAGPYQFIEALYSKEELDAATDRINRSIGAMNEKKLNGELSGDELYFMEAYPCCSFPWDLNRIVVSFKAEESSEDFERLITLFEEYIGKYEGVIYEGDPDYQPADFYSANLCAGGKLWRLCMIPL